MFTPLADMKFNERDIFSQAFYGFYKEKYGNELSFDKGNPTPWSSPWTWNKEINLSGFTPYEWGLAWAQQCEEDILYLIQLYEKTSPESCVRPNDTFSAA